MSVRAYKIVKLETDRTPTFNLWSDTKFLEFVRNDENNGQIEISVETLEEALTQVKELELEDYTVDAIKADIRWAKKKGDNYISYMCY